MQKKLVYLSLIIIVILAACQQGKRSGKEGINRDTSHYTKQEYIAQALDSNFVGTFLDRNPQFAAYGEAIRDFYRKRGYHYAWINEEGITEQAGGFMNMMRQDEESGIKDSTLDKSRVMALYDSLALMGDSLNRTDSIVPITELTLTGQFFVYGNLVWGGITSDNAKNLEWFIPRKKIDISSLLDSVIANPKERISKEEPVNRQYKLLRDELQKLALIVSKHPAWDSLKLADKKKTFKLGDSSVLIPVIKQRLSLLGDLKEKDTSALFTQPLDSALKNYQERMGHKPDGIIKQQTLDALNRPLEHYMHQLMLNMERLRWVPVEVNTDYILVNIPEFKMHAYENGKLAWDCNVVVGTPGASTVIFSREMKFIVFSPYWNVPPGILSKEVLPGIKRSGNGYLNRLNMEIVGSSGKVLPLSSINVSKYSGSNFPYIVRQKPGGANSLGKVKFLFPNEYNIYLHDTPSKGLFNETKRSFSHGCIRVSEPKRLAQWLLRKDSSWTEAKIDAAMNAGKEKYVTLKEKVPVYIGYFTAWVNYKGQLNFRDDVYGHDAKLAKLLFGK
ncbi:L,D-transpeptidase family protein [Chitinophaga niabensis]|uniref:Murein L,D-transpeptidase YcbB/YkuD n=1 Tax=Chitinophaga niabensis TaxID=536979 RepID=A0A1N6JI68_9BACT|nr:L,D-transpeptidase family protein [Chitinophaga niabensis]SIO43867.1 Murein L,D-transpeptidase YcbB/YkuD [Chitinophaga niabensis]